MTKRKLAVCLFLGLPTIAAWAQTSVGTSFSYQGRLDHGGVPANGAYDFQAGLFDAATVGTQIGSTLTSNDLPVVNGLFTTFMDFGAAAFVSDARWIEISVRPGASIGAYTALTPRQRIRATPFAVQSLNDAHWAKSGLSISNTNIGNVGVNQDNPLARLHVTGANELPTFDFADLDTDQVVVEGQQAWLGLYSDNTGAAASGISLGEIDTITGALTKWSLVQRTSGSGNDFSITYGSDPSGNANDRYFQVKSDGDVGIGVDNPSAKLHVKSVGATENVIPASFRAVSEFPVASGTSTEYIQFEGTEVSAIKDGANATLKLQQSGGQVRIGSLNITVDDPKLTVSRNSSLITNDDLQFEDVLIHDTGNAWLGLYSDSLGNVGSGITFAESDLVNTHKWGMYARTTDNVGDLVITYGTDVNPTANEKMLQIDRDGTTKVKVLEILGADVAERFPTTEKVQPGHVVMIDAANPGQLCLARGAYNSRVAGVVSGAGDLPVGAILGNLPGMEDAPAIALSGRVWTLCEASNGAIEPGDLLTTAETPGYAMKATDSGRRQGAVIGKAMTCLAAGESGLVLVLIQAQ